MSKALVMLISLTLLGLMPAAPLGAETVNPKQDLKEFQDYFKKHFSYVPFDDFANGLYALKGAEDRRAEWESIMEYPPFELELEEGRKFWETNNLGACFQNRAANHYPYWDKDRKEVRSVELDINDCLMKQGKSPIKDLNKGTMAQVVAYYRSTFKGKRIKIDLSDPGALEEYKEGRKFFWAKRGQLNFSCADCHIHGAGKYIGGNILSTALGHGLGFPVYRSKWGNLGTLHRRYGGCNKQVRAQPLKPQSRQYRALELYEAYMNTGLPLTAPSQRF